MYKLRVGLVGLLSICMLVGCDKSKEATPKSPVDDQKAKSAEPAVSRDQKKPPSKLDEGMVVAHLTRLQAKLKCKDTQSVWCAPMAGYGAAPFVALPSATSETLVGLTLWVPTKGEVNTKALYPATFAYRHDGKTVYGEVVRIKNRSEANANHIKGMVHQVKSQFNAVKPSILLTEKKLFSYVQRRPEKAKHMLNPHTKGWQVQGGNRADVRKVGDVWISVHSPNVKKGEAEGIHVSIFKSMAVTSRPGLEKDVNVDALSKRLGCDKLGAKSKTLASKSCAVIEGFKAGVEIKKPKRGKTTQLWAGDAYRVRGSEETVQLIGGLTVGADGRIDATFADMTGKIKSFKSKTAPKTIGDALSKATYLPTRSSGPKSRVHQQVGLFKSFAGTKTYNYLRQKDDTLYLIAHDPMGGLAWYGMLKKVPAK